MPDNKGFDLWADGYDKTVGISDEEQSYPFAGYKGVLAKIYQLVMTKEKAKVLDIGFGMDNNWQFDLEEYIRQGEPD